MMVRWGVPILLVVLASLAAVFIWPTQYSYTKNPSDDGTYIRRDRLDGGVRIITAEQRKHPRLVPKRLPREAILRITARVSLKKSGQDWYWQAKIHNGSDWRVTDLTLLIMHYERTGIYTVPCTIDPRTDGSCSVLLNPGSDSPSKRPITAEQIEKGATDEQRMWMLMGGHGFHVYKSKPWKR